MTKVLCPGLSPSLPVTQLQVFQMLLQWCGLHCRRRSKSTASGLRNFCFVLDIGRLGELWPHFIILELGLFSFALRCSSFGSLSLAANSASGDSKQQLASRVALTIACCQAFTCFTNIAAVLVIYLIIVVRLTTFSVYVKL